MGKTSEMSFLVTTNCMSLMDKTSEMSLMGLMGKTI